MERISQTERKYVLDVLDNNFRSSKGGFYTKKLEELFAKKIESNLNKNSLFICEIGNNQLSHCKKIFDNTNLILKKVTKDIQNIDRTLTFFKI